MGIVAHGQITARWPQEQSTPLDGYYRLYGDDDGSVDYSAALTPRQVQAWPDGEGKIGAGLGPAGSGPAGIGYGGIGCGMGGAGMGLCGFGAGMLEAATRRLDDGDWTLAVVGFDPTGNPAAPAGGPTATAEVAGTPAAAIVTADEYNDGTDTLTLAITLSSDDEG